MLCHVRSAAPRSALLPDNIVFRNVLYIRAVRKIVVARTLLLVRRNHKKQLLDAAIAPVAGSFLSSSAAVACWVANVESTLRFGINFLNKGDLLGT